MSTEPTQHSGDCTIYRSLINGSPTDGICTCGYGWTLVRQGDWSQMYSDERPKPTMAFTERLQLHIRQMAPHQLDREQGKLLVEAFNEIRRLEGELARESRYRCEESGDIRTMLQPFGFSLSDHTSSTQDIVAEFCRRVKTVTTPQTIANVPPLE